MENTTKKQISISEIITLLHSGYTRTSNAKNYDPEVGSIEEYYELPREQVKLLFEHEKLQGVRTKKVVRPVFDLVDDTTEESDDTPTGEAVTTNVATVNDEIYDCLY